MNAHNFVIHPICIIVQCTKEKCVYELNPAECNDCLKPNVEYTFSIAPVLANAQLGPAITVSKKIGEYLTNSSHPSIRIISSGLFKDHCELLYLLNVVTIIIAHSY